ncbi:MAG: ABC transporter permease [Saprospiraceae bacterium]|nr:ABC transporter permease [Saprospiraceae bacterium]
MLRNYFLIALRNFQRQRVFSILNMFGLALGLASAIFIFLYVSDELQYDTMHPYYKDTYRLGCTFANADGRSNNNTDSPGFWVRQLKDTRTEVQDAVRIAYIGYPTSLHHKAKDKIVLTEEIKWAEPGFDRVLAFKLRSGNPEKMFEAPNTMVLSETGARKLFGKSDPIGQIVSVKHNFATRDRELDIEVTGVYRDYPSNSHFKPDYILNVNALRSVYPDFNRLMEGSSFGDRENPIFFFENYIVFKPNVNIPSILAMLQPLADQMMRSDSAFVAAGWKMSPFLTKMSDFHFDTVNEWEYNAKGNKQYLTIFSAIAVLIMLIACINYMNLATARSARRAKEVGLRKSLGSNRKEIAAQFFMESFLMTLGALAISLVLVLALLQPFNVLADKTFSMASLLNPWMLGIVALIVAFMGLLSGIYPALYLSAFRPVEVLKGHVAKGKGAELFKKGLVASQYVVSLVLIICTLIVIRQMEHMQTTKLNEQGDQLLSIRYGGIAPPEKFAAFKQVVLQDKDIEHVTIGNHLPRLDYFGFIGYRVKFPDLGNNELDWNQLNVEYDFAKTYGLEIIAGRDFEANNPSDSSAILLNEAAVKALNQPVDKILGAFAVDLFQEGNATLKVIGIVKDFPFRSMHNAIEPLMLSIRPHFIDRIVYVKLPAGKFQEKVASVEKAWKEVFPGIGFDHWFVSDEFNRMYIVEGRVAALAKVFAILAILITILGVFGLASYTAEQKTKEVGIRKALGADVLQVIGMFLWIFIKIFVVASCIAVPIAYAAASYWLKDFVYRVPLSPWIFIGSLTGLLLVTLFTVSREIWKAARMNPVVSLRSE